MPLPKFIDELTYPSGPNARRLVSIRYILSIQPCVGNQSKDMAEIDGWRVAVDKDDFQPGSIVLFCEPDCFLPANNPMFTQGFGGAPPMEYMGVKGYRVTSQLVGQEISQGKVFSLEDFPEVTKTFRDLVDYYNGEEDVAVMDIGLFCFAARLSVAKWEAAFLSDECLGAMPPFIRKTSIERHANCPNLFTKSKYFQRLYQESVKLDGCSMTVYFIGKNQPAYRSCNPARPGNSFTEGTKGRIGVCSHRKEIAENKDSLYWQAAIKYNLPQQLHNLGQNIAIQGELCGSTINGNREKFPDGEHDFFIFDVWDIDTKKYWAPDRTVQLAAQLNCKHVPVRGDFKIRSIAFNHQGLSNRAEALNAEGLVYKCAEDGRRFKVHNRKWLLNHGE
ncbi:uncharacterized protein E0L32_002847 [Thyridium curvatum]|uniref:RNA ligase domain-containing protein n=1 Tax=Thyridium curvatum TaxID=1093900 RepID=A0A507BEJ6_9PEZI|nr:uncharacterized protein E0L32_002847 [Thyridium curvatum]TPX17746.1 hypothetical protein E0L32_002847 [Thyridium curvatum]